MIKKTLICVIFLTFFNSSSNSIAATEIIVDEAVNQLIKNLGNVETATKGKKLKQFFAGNSLRLSFNGKIKEFKFNEDKYEVFENEKSIEIGKWKVSGILKNQIKLTPNNKSKPYFLKKINNKEIIYHYNSTPGKEGTIKTLVKIEPLIKEKTKVAEKKEEPKNAETKVAEKKEEPKNAETKVAEKKEEPKKIVKDGKVPEGKKKILKYVCDPNKSEYYWGRTKNNMKLSRYEDSPNGKSLAYEGNDTFVTLWSVAEIDFEAGYVYDSGSMRYDANGDGRLNTMPFAVRSKINSHDQSQGIFFSESEYSFENDPNFEEIAMEVNYSENSLEYTLETYEFGLGKRPKYWEKYTTQCIRTHYYIDKNAGDNFIKTYNDQKPIAEQAEKNIFSSQVEEQFQLQTDSLFDEINQQVLKEIGIVEDQYKDVSKNINQNKDLKNESQKFVKEVSKDQLKEYKATSVLTYYFFESQANYLASLELLYRAYDKNVEADKMKAQLIYLKDSKSSESKRLKSTTQILDQASKDIKNNINDKNKNLSDGSKILYQESLPFAFKATEYG